MTSEAHQIRRLYVVIECSKPKIKRLIVVYSLGRIRLNAVLALERWPKTISFFESVIKGVYFILFINTVSPKPVSLK